MNSINDKNDNIDNNIYEIEKKYKSVYYYKDLCKINIDYFRGICKKLLSNDNYTVNDYEKSEICLEHIALNKLGFYTLEGKKGRIEKIYKNRDYTIGFFNKNYYPYFKEYLSNRDDIYFDFKCYTGKFDFTNMTKDDTDLELKNESDDDFTKVWKIVNEFDSIKHKEYTFKEYKLLCNDLFFENLCNNYIILFVSNKSYKSNICINKILLFLIDYSNLKIKEEKEKQVI